MAAKCTEAVPVEQIRWSMPTPEHVKSIFSGVLESSSAKNVARSLAVGALVGIGLRGMQSIATMVAWRLKLRDSETGEPAPGPPPLPFIGNVLSLRTGYYETLYKYVDKPASVFWVMSTPFVVLNDEEGLRRVLGGSNGLYAKPKYFGYRSKAVKNAVAVEQKTVEKESLEYKNDGDTSRVALENMVIDSLWTMKVAMNELLTLLAEASEEVAADKATSGTAVLSSVRTAIVKLNLDVLFDLTDSSIGPSKAEDISSMIGFAGMEFARRMVNPFKALVDIPGNVRYFGDVMGLISFGRRLCRVLDDTAEEREGLKSAPKAEAVKSTAGLSWVHAWVGKVGKIGKLGKVVGLLMASTQTVPLTAVWMLHLVANDDGVRSQLREELHGISVRSACDLQYDDLGKLPLADAVVKETLRLYPPFPLIQREAQGADVLCGITIPAGTPVYVVPWLVHRNPKLWSDADSFKPRRFLENASHGDAPSDWAFLPFGRGVRMCAGSKLALTELKVLLVHAVLEYDIVSEGRAMGRGSRFPELGMIPEGIDMRVRKKTRGR